VLFLQNLEEQRNPVMEGEISPTEETLLQGEGRDNGEIVPERKWDEESRELGDERIFR